MAEHLEETPGAVVIEERAEGARLHLPVAVWPPLRADEAERVAEGCPEGVAGGANRSTHWGESLHPPQPQLERIAPAPGHFFPIRARFGVWHGMCIYFLT